MPYRRRYGGYGRATKRRAYARGFFASQPHGEGTSTYSLFGADRKAANAQQRILRNAVGYRGAGMYTGQGGFWNTMRKGGEWLGKTVLDANPGGYGAPIRAAMHMAGYRGMGAYEAGPQTNDLAGAGSTIAQFSQIADETGAIIVQQREYIGDIFGNQRSTSFTNNSLALNPGLENTFPWLSQIAMNFEEYEFKQLMFEMKTTVADVSSTNGQVGTFVAATNYNPDSDPFQDKQTMMQYAHAQSAKSTEGLLHFIECDPRKNSGTADKFVRARPVVLGEDLKSYDHGLFQYAVVGTPASMANQPMGELWVNYTVMLRKPKFFTGKGLGISRFLGASPWVATVLANSAGANTRVLCPFGETRTGTNVAAFLQAQQNNFPVQFQAAVSTGTGTFLTGNPTLKSINALNTDILPRNGVDNSLIALTSGSPAVDTALATTPITNRIVFPASFSGNVRIVISIAGNGLGSSVTTAAALSPPIIIGNINPAIDLLASNNILENPEAAASFVASNMIRTSHKFDVASPTYCPFVMTMILHYKITPAANGIDNQLVWTSYNNAWTQTTCATTTDTAGYNLILSGSTGGAYPTIAVAQSYIDISEYNSGFGTSPSIDIPTFVNLAGQVQNPYT